MLHLGHRRASPASPTSGSGTTDWTLHEAPDRRANAATVAGRPPRRSLVVLLRHDDKHPACSPQPSFLARPLQPRRAVVHRGLVAVAAALRVAVAGRHDVLAAFLVPTGGHAGPQGPARSTDATAVRRPLSSGLVLDGERRRELRQPKLAFLAHKLLNETPQPKTMERERRMERDEIGDAESAWHVSAWSPRGE